MSHIVLDSHNLLGQLTIIKNCLSLLLEKPDLDKKYLQTAFDANQKMIDEVKSLAQNEKNTDN